MSKKKIVEVKEASVVDEQPVVATNNGYNGDYTRYFYRQIENLWASVKELQQENNELSNQLSLARVVYGKGD